jgi:peptide/nickel transport system ATP-binding protein/oligopeptide transport system ATP-binding protein
MLEVKNLRKEFGQRGNILQPKKAKVAVDDVSFSVNNGSTLALVGESGSGKSTVGLMILGLLAVTGGEVLFEGTSIVGRDRKARKLLKRNIQVVFQDPYASLNARMTVEEAVTEGMIVHKIGTNPADRVERARVLLAQVGLPDDALSRYPHEFSGGQRQRIAIARALSVEPKFLILDEPTSALDVSVQSQVLNLLRRLQKDFGLSYLFITHNLAVVEYLADEVCVMQRGLIVERGTVDDVFDRPQNPYTQRLLSSIPSPDPENRRLVQA